MIVFGLFALALYVLSVLFYFITPAIFNYSLLAAFFCTSLFAATHAKLRQFAFAAWVIFFVATSLLFPPIFGSWFGINLQILIVPLLQIIMFGMGTTLSVKDFSRVFKMPWPVIIGLLLQFSVMPLAGWGITQLFHFDPEIAAGIILVGSCPGGVASNLMTYIAGGNVALSVTMTSCSTLASPLLTPFLMQTLAGKLVPIHVVAMMLSILNMIIVPIIAGLYAHTILYSRKKFYNSSIPLLCIMGLSTALALLSSHLPDTPVFASIQNGLTLGFILVAIVTAAKLIVNVIGNGPENWMERVLPLLSMIGICVIIAIITARTGEKLFSVGFALLCAAIIHSFIGFVLGYWIARIVRLEESSCRTIAFEVGMQNSGMASGLAMTVLNSANAALGPALFGPWMNIVGSVTANYMRKK